MKAIIITAIICMTMVTISWINKDKEPMFRAPRRKQKHDE